ncbi:MAG: hypothetical protein V1838_04610 [Patescibacteria group bacterium]
MPLTISNLAQFIVENEREHHINLDLFIAWVYEAIKRGKLKLAEEAEISEEESDESSTNTSQTPTQELVASSTNLGDNTSNNTTDPPDKKPNREDDYREK